MESIKDTLRVVMSELKSGKAASAGAPEEILKKILTKRELKHIKFNYFRKGVLGVVVDSSSWLYQLSIKKENLLARATEVSDVVKDIRLRLGDIK